MCTQEISNDYASKKRHVFEKHLENISYDQRLIRSVAMLEKCFKQEGILFITNDAQCNVCGREVSDRGICFCLHGLKIIWILLFVQHQD
jgi:predicted Zn-ribbon and HTH transcriptional regulator